VVGYKSRGQSVGISTKHRKTWSDSLAPIMQDPVFSWKNPIGITDIEFLNTTRLGSEYADNVIVGDINNGNLYYFKVNSSRTGIAVPDSLGLDNEGQMYLSYSDCYLSSFWSFSSSLSSPELPSLSSLSLQ
jgi:hypothetical protein